MGPLVKLVGSGIGLASEALAARKERKESEQRSRSPAAPGSSALVGHSGDTAPPAYDSLDPTSSSHGLVEVADEHEARQLIDRGKAVPAGTSHGVDEHDPEDPEGADDDEAYWELDEATDPDPPAYGYSPSARGETDHAEPESGEAKPDVHKLVQKFLTSHPAPTYTTGRLPCPVIIPQRRPRTKSRGFVRAYAPVLADCGVDQDTFLEFLKTFHKASQVDNLPLSHLTVPCFQGRSRVVRLLLTSSGIAYFHGDIPCWPCSRLRSQCIGHGRFNHHAIRRWSSNSSSITPQVCFPSLPLPFYAFWSANHRPQDKQLPRRN